MISTLVGAIRNFDVVLKGNINIDSYKYTCIRKDQTENMIAFKCFFLS